MRPATCDMVWRTNVEQREPLLQLRHISKRFGAVQALADVEFEVYAGEVVGLVGDNGAGKSTLIKIIAGVYRADAGEYRYDGRVVGVHSPREASSLGIETVYQDLALCDNLDVVANLFLGRERTQPLVATLGLGRSPMAWICWLSPRRSNLW